MKEMCGRDCFSCPFADCIYSGPPRRGELQEVQRQVDTLLMLTSPAPKPKGRKRAVTTSKAVHGSQTTTQPYYTQPRGFTQAPGGYHA